MEYLQRTAKVTNLVHFAVRRLFAFILKVR